MGLFGPRGRVATCPACDHGSPFGFKPNVAAATIECVIDQEVPWLVLVLRVPAKPSRHRVAVWRELRKIGAVPLGQGAWAAPDVPGFAGGIVRVGELTARGDGQMVVLRATGRTGQDAAWLEAEFTALRQEEWAEFIADCGKFDAEIDKEFALQKFTMAELEERADTGPAPTVAPRAVRPGRLRCATGRGGSAAAQALRRAAG